MSKVFLIDSEKRPLDPIHSAQARQLLRNKKAAIFRQFPFTLILAESRPDSRHFLLLSETLREQVGVAQGRSASPVSQLRLKLDPGAKTTGIALVNDSMIFAACLEANVLTLYTEDFGYSSIDGLEIVNPFG